MRSLLLMAAGETEEQYERTEALVREVGFDRVNTAAYSPRPNTPAATWEGQVADLIKLDRLNRCVDAVQGQGSKLSHTTAAEECNAAGKPVKQTLP